MPSPVTLEFRHHSRKGMGFTLFYTGLLLLSLHWAIVLYINSSYVGQFVGEKTVSGLYILGAIITILSFLFAPTVLSRFGNITTAQILTVLECVALIGMAFTGNIYLAILFFIVHQAIVPLILFSLDVILEDMIGEKEGITGSRRGLILAFMSLVGALSALGMGKLVGDGFPNFALVYLASATALIPFFFILQRARREFVDPEYPSIKIFQGIKNFWEHHDIRYVFLAHFLLQFFFTWMVIYTPLYLANIIGFNWEDIGVILFAGLMAYVFLEYPIGIIADKYIGEKEMMAFGFAILAISTSWFVFLDNSSLFAWMIAMFMTRVGASFVETTTESYFFKHTESKDTNIIGLFRITRPLSYVVGAGIGTLTLSLFNFHILFIILGLLMVPGLFFAMTLHDTK